MGTRTARATRTTRANFTPLGCFQMTSRGRCESNTTVATFQSFCSVTLRCFGHLLICVLMLFHQLATAGFFCENPASRRWIISVFVKCSSSVFYQRIYHFSGGDGLIGNLMSIHQMAEWLCQLAFSGRLPDRISVQEKGWRDAERAAS